MGVPKAKGLGFFDLKDTALIGWESNRSGQIKRECTILKGMMERLEERGEVDKEPAVARGGGAKSRRVNYPAVSRLNPNIRCRVSYKSRKTLKKNSTFIEYAYPPRNSGDL